MSGRSKRVAWEKAMDVLGAQISAKVEHVNEAVERAVEKTASKAARDLRQEKYLPRTVPTDSSKNNSKRTKLGVHSKAIRNKDGGKREPGTYKAHFSQKKMSKISKSKSDFRRIVYVKSPEYRLTHLLENGHRVSNKFGFTGKYTRSVKHFQPAEEQAEKDLLKYAKEEVKASLGAPL